MIINGIALGLSKKIKGFMKRFLRVIFHVCLLSITIISFQNCESLKGKDVPISTKLASAAEGGNGEPYGGKLTSFYYFEEGYTCKDPSGNDIPSPKMIIEKIDDIFKVTQEACQIKDEVIASENVVMNKDGQSVRFDFRRFQVAVTPEVFVQNNYFFNESHCAETLKSRIKRRYGTESLPPEEMKSAVTDEVEVFINNTYYGDRRATVIVRHDVPTVILSPLQIQSSTYTISNLILGLDAVSVKYTTNSNEFFMTVENPDPNAGVQLQYSGPMSMSQGDVVLNGVEMKCNVYPH